MMSYSVNLIVYFIYLISLYIGLNSASSCGNSEICIPITNCLSINERLYDENISDSEVKKISKLQCAYVDETVYVCCKSSLPLPPDCGPLSVSPRIVGGNTTHIYDYPWTVLLGTLIYKDDEEVIKYNCGGSLISDQYIITAAHCIKVMSKKIPGVVATRRIRKIRLGEWDLEQEPIDIEVLDPFSNRTNIGDPVVDLNIEKMIVHEKYHPLSKLYDIALIKLAEKVNYTNFIKPICLPDKDQEIEEDLIVVGWGKTENESRSNIKRYAYIPVWSEKNCAERYKTEINAKIDSTQLCAGGTDGIADSCQGDSGGPLIGYNTSNPFRIYHYLAGIVSFGFRDCGQGKLPGVYTNVKSYLKWINDNMEHSG